MSEAELDFLCTLLKRHSGLSIGADKRYLIESRLAPVCRKHGIADLSALVAVLRGGSASDLRQAVIEAMMTNETLFFRDKLPFDLFRTVLLPHYLARRGSMRRLRIWCAAASSGQEPYSLAMILDEHAGRLAGWSVEIIATDISSDIVDRAKAGLYSQFEIQRGLPIALLLKHFSKEGTQWRISEAMRRKVDFRPLNLMNDFAHLGVFDIVFCRNVMIYFDLATKATLLRRLSRSLGSDGTLMLGASETALGLSNALVPHEEHRSLYRPAGAMAGLDRPHAMAR